MSKPKIAQDTDENAVEQTELEKPKERPLRGRGGRNNFGTSLKENLHSEKDKALISKLLNETYVALNADYHKLSEMQYMSLVLMRTLTICLRLLPKQLQA